MRVEQFMSQPVVTCHPSDALSRPAQLMWEHDCGAVPVVQDDGTLAGIVTDRDICMAAYTQGVSLHAIPTSTAMAKRVFSCHADDGIEVAERLMMDKQVRRIPVVDGDGRPIGIISLGDIVRYVTAPQTQSGLRTEVAQTLAAICEPRQRALHVAPESQIERWSAAV